MIIVGMFQKNMVIQMGEVMRSQKKAKSRKATRRISLIMQLAKSRNLRRERLWRWERS